MNGKFILGIDPGFEETAWVLVDESLRPVKFAKEENHTALQSMIDLYESGRKIEAAIEMIASYGMPVGREVFDTCVWIGVFSHALNGNASLHRIYRKEEKLLICGSMKATDATIKHALVDRFAYGTRNGGKGTKDSPGFFYGFRKDIWQAFAVAVTYHDKVNQNEI